MRVIRGLLVILLLTLGAASIGAQDDDEGEGTDVDLTLYADIPQSRADDGAFVLGDPDAPVTVIEFADYLCPHCQDYEEVSTAFIEEYVVTGQAKFEYRFFPVVDDTLSPLLSNMSECAAEKELFWPAHTLIYDLARERAIGGDIVQVFTEALELDEEDFTTCITEADQYITDQRLGSSLGVSGTPAIRVQVGDDDPGVLVVDDRPYSSGGIPLEQLAAFVESESPEEMVTYDFSEPPLELLNEALLQDTSLVDADEDCVAPCWRGIIPGESTWEEAIETLESDDSIGELEVQTQQTLNLATFAPAEGEACCQLVSDPTGESVERIILQFAPEMTLEGVIDTQGEPQYVTGSLVDAEQGIFELYYPESSMVVLVYYDTEVGELTEDSEILGAAYLAPGFFTGIEGASLPEWAGFGEYDIQ